MGVRSQRITLILSRSSAADLGAEQHLAEELLLCRPQHERVDSCRTGSRASSLKASTGEAEKQEQTLAESSIWRKSRCCVAQNSMLRREPRQAAVAADASNWQSCKQGQYVTSVTRVTRCIAVRAGSLEYEGVGQQRTKT